MKHPQAMKELHQVESLQELASDIFPILRYVGPHMSWDPVLMVKLIRMGKYMMQRVVCQFV